MGIGFAALVLGVPGAKMRGTMMKNADTENLATLIEHNLDALDTIITYNLKNGLKLYRISSDLIPFGSSPVNTLPWWEIYAEKLAAIGAKARRGGMRLSMHPGQYTVLNSPDADVAARAVDDLVYHARVLDGLNTGPEHKIILHVGGAYQNKREALERFKQRYNRLDEGIVNRLVIENDERTFNIDEVLKLGLSLNIPVVFDNLHHSINHAEPAVSDRDIITACGRIWKEKDGRQKIHYSQQNPGKRSGAHSHTIRIAEFLAYYDQIGGSELDIMLEVKDKNISALKCVNCTAEKGEIRVLEEEWRRYKYKVLEHSPGAYRAIRNLLKDKQSYPALEFYSQVEQALQAEVTAGNAVNAALHVWGYLKECATSGEQRKITAAIEAAKSGKQPLGTVKKMLQRLAEKYEQNYLMESYYFAL